MHMIPSMATHLILNSIKQHKKAYFHTFLFTLEYIYMYVYVYILQAFATARDYKAYKNAQREREYHG